MRALSLLSFLAAQAVNASSIMHTTLATQQASHNNVLSVEACVTRLEEKELRVSLEESAERLVVSYDAYNPSTFCNFNAEVCQAANLFQDQVNGVCSAMQGEDMWNLQVHTYVIVCGKCAIAVTRRKADVTSSVVSNTYPL